MRTMREDRDSKALIHIPFLHSLAALNKTHELGLAVSQTAPYCSTVHWQYLPRDTALKPSVRATNSLYTHTGAVATKIRRHDLRVHPYQRILTADRAATGN
ncbi:hypothetical protein SKAU_G00271250 [Synaphobranchus kaupii]|uniref:Protein quaking putative nuclear localisation signal domain-containing protein n=1 Tax=Synaphobranchus kaupii TaxID=118154 RepID=A0A9Q1F0N7_SYNKA|nr:hypothetical protein SKAU_G00271250 [Synaphobranchus kaupii]